MSTVSIPPVRPAERYGDLRPAWHSTLARVLVVTLAVLGLGWVIWAGWTAAQKDVRFEDVGFRVLGPGSTEATFDVTVYTGTTATCTVQALAEDFSVVGSQQVKVSVERSGQTSRDTTTILTSQPAVSAVVSACSVP